MKSKHYYLIVQWFPHRKQTKENPACIFGKFNYFVEYPLENINPEKCYTSLKQAERYAEKNMTLYSRCEVIEVPQSALV